MVGITQSVLDGPEVFIPEIKTRPKILGGSGVIYPDSTENSKDIRLYLYGLVSE